MLFLLATLVGWLPFLDPLGNILAEKLLVGLGVRLSSPAFAQALEEGVELARMRQKNIRVAMRI